MLGMAKRARREHSPTEPGAIRTRLIWAAVRAPAIRRLTGVLVLLGGCCFATFVESAECTVPGSSVLNILANVTTCGAQDQDTARLPRGGAAVPVSTVNLKEGNAPTAFRDCPNCPEVVSIPAGAFSMGSPPDEAGRSDIEGPVRRVTIAAFALAKSKITRGQFAAFVSETNHKTDNDCYTFENGEWNDRINRDWRNPGFPQEDNHPAVCISWFDAKAYAKWLSEKTGKTYRLPTEAEWEYAARAGTTTSRHWGDDAAQACKFANVLDATTNTKVSGAAKLDSHACDDGYAYTAPVMSFKPNGFGLYDMIGNAWEWVEDCDGTNSYGRAPADGRPSTLGSCHYRGLRSASWLSTPANARAASRNSGVALIHGSGVGFRLVRTLP